jgi:hypothetical protein
MVPRDGRRVVRGAIVDDDSLDIARHEPANALQKPSQETRFVVSGNDY